MPTPLPHYTTCYSSSNTALQHPPATQTSQSGDSQRAAHCPQVRAEVLEVRRGTPSPLHVQPCKICKKERTHNRNTEAANYRKNDLITTRNQTAKPADEHQVHKTSRKSTTKTDNDRNCNCYYDYYRPLLPNPPKKAHYECCWHYDYHPPPPPPNPHTPPPSNPRNKEGGREGGRESNSERVRETERERERERERTMVSTVSRDRAHPVRGEGEPFLRQAP